MTTAPVPGQPAAAFPVAPLSGRAGILAVPVAVVAVTAVVVGLLTVPTAPGPVLAGAGLTALVGVQATLWARQRRLTGALQRSQCSFRTLVKSSVDPVVILDDHLRITYASPGIADLLGCDAAAVVGLPVLTAVHPDDRTVLPGALDAERADHAGPGELAVRTARVRHADGRWRLIQATVRDLRADPDVGALVLFCRDVTARVPAAGIDPDLHDLALTDPVTGLPNRSALVRRLGAVQRQPRPSALALVRISGLAAEVLAPDTETAVLRALTARLTRALRGADWLAHGRDGDFVVLVDGGIADAETVATRLVAAVGPVPVPGGSLRLTAAAGVTALPSDVDAGEALRRGELALRSAVTGGPGSVHRYDDALRTEEDRRATLSADLDGALQRGELRLVFQPVVDVVMHRTVSVEALLRWRHPVFGEVSPTEFVPLAEESALILELGRWVLREACTTVAAIDAAPDGTRLGVAVNVSARQVRSGELVPDVIAALESSGLPPSRLVLEITESVLLDDSHVIEDLTVLRRLGVRVAVDDFGTGWSSLAYLVDMPVDVLKMDRYFLNDVEHDPARRAMCRAVLQLGSSLGLPVVVEGVTDETVLALLRDMGHRYLQGYVFARPLEAAQLAAGAWDVQQETALAARHPGAPS